MYVLAFLDKDGNGRPPKNWNEVKEMFCKRWDTCEPCLHYSGHTCTHELHPQNRKDNTNV